MKERIRKELKQNNGFRIKLGLFTYRIGFIEFHICKNNIKKLLLRVLYKTLRVVCLFFSITDIPPRRSYIDWGLRLPHGFDNIKINSWSRIGQNCTIYHNVTIGELEGKNRSLLIGDNCYIGTSSLILGECKIGNNCKIGAGTKIINETVRSNSTIITTYENRIIS